MLEQPGFAPFALRLVDAQSGIAHEKRFERLAILRVDP
jgi:hypothetical protein